MTTNYHSLKAFEDNQESFKDQDRKTLQFIAQSKKKGVNALEHAAVFGCHKSVSGKTLDRCRDKNALVHYMDRKSTGESHGRYYLLEEGF